MATARRLQQLRDRRRTPTELAHAASPPTQAAAAATPATTVHAPSQPEEPPTHAADRTDRYGTRRASGQRQQPRHTPPRAPAAPTAAAPESPTAPSLSFANREAAEQALAAGRSVLGSGNLQRALTLLCKVRGADGARTPPTRAFAASSSFSDPQPALTLGVGAALPHAHPHTHRQRATDL